MSLLILFRDGLASMNRRNVWIFCLAFIMAFIAFGSKVEASEILKSDKTYNVNGDVIGNITLYDDYKIEFSFKYRLKNILVVICESDNCLDTTVTLDYGNNTVLNEEPYEELGSISYDLSEYLVAKETNVLYSIRASGDFKPTLSASFGSVLTMNTEVLILAAGNDPSVNREAEIMKWLNEVKGVFNTWIIPGLYIVLGCILVIKSILLVIDLIKYADYADIRKEKLRAFLYLGIVVGSVACINTGLAIITGLFN